MKQLHVFLIIVFRTLATTLVYVKHRFMGPKYRGLYKDPNNTNPKDCCPHSRPNCLNTWTAGTHQVWPGKRCPKCGTHYDDIDPYSFY